MTGLLTTFLHLSDVHARADPTECVHARRPDATLDRVLAYASGAVDAVVVTGDVSDDGCAASCERVLTKLRAAAAEVRWMPGNRDDPAVLRRAAPECLEPLALPGGWLVVPIDTHMPGEDAGNLMPEEVARVDSVVAESRADHVILAMHHPPVAPCSAPRCSLVNPVAALDLIRLHPTIRAVLSGHQHQAFAIESDGVWFLGAPSTCVQAQHPGDGFEVTGDPPGGVLIEVTADGGLVPAVFAA